MPITNSLETRVRARLEDLRVRQLLRNPRPPSGIDLSSNDYLNLSADPRITAALITGVQREGCGSTGSRLLRGERPAFVAVERQFAQFKGAERSLFFSSGYLANLAVLGALPEDGDVIFSDERNHASLIDATKLSRARGIVCPHNDVEGLARLMNATACSGIRFVVVESLYSMDGDLARLAEYAALCRSADAILIVDEAHAVGIYGDGGTGLIEAAGVSGEVAVSINTAGKALGVGGAFVSGPAWAIDYLVQRARTFVFSTAPPPALADALSASLAIIRDEPDRRTRLLARAERLRRRLRVAGIELADGISQIVPIMIGDNQRAVAVAQRMQSEGYDIRAIRPPSVPPGTARLRLSVNAGLSEATIDRVVDALSDVLGTRHGMSTHGDHRKRL
jgi:8-amino-7-oxononanoate synthase